MRNRGRERGEGKEKEGEWRKEEKEGWREGKGGRVAEGGEGRMEGRKTRESGGRGGTHLRSLVVPQRWHVTTENRTVGHNKILVTPERERARER